jgi:integrase
MAVRPRGSKWIADYYDAFSRRRWKTFRTKADAKNFEASQLAAKAAGGTLAPVVDPDITFSAYGARYLKICAALQLKEASLIRFEGTLRNHLVPGLGGMKVREISRPIVRQLLLEKFGAEANGGRLGNGRIKRTFKTLAASTVRLMFKVVSAILSAAVEDGLRESNPLRGMWKALGKVGTKDASKDVKTLAFDTEEAARFLEAAALETPERHAILALMLFAGLRVGEALALQASKIDFGRRKIRVDVQLRITSPKDNEARTVDMAEPLAAILRPIVDRRTSSGKVVAIDAPRDVDAATGEWLFFPKLSATPTRNEKQNVYKSICGAFRRARRAAGLAQHHTPKSLRHTFGSQLISRGVSPAYVQQQMGHSTIGMTVDTYGSWLPVVAAGAVDAFASSIVRGCKTVASETKSTRRKA